MGRTKVEGPKNLIHVSDISRFQKVFFTNGSSRLPYLISTDRYDEIIARFERRGFKPESKKEA